MRALQLVTVLATVISQTCGEYDTYKRVAEVIMPKRAVEVRNSLVDPITYNEVMFNMISYLVPTDSEEPACRNHSMLYQEAVMQDELWAIKMLDSLGKPGGGLLEGNFQLLGNYDECLAVDGPDRQFTGQLCVVRTHGLFPSVVPQISNVEEYALVPRVPTEPTLAVCVPSTCSANAVQAHWQGVMEEFNASATVSAVDCSTRGDTPLDTRAWFTIWVLATLFAAIVSSTVYDYWVDHQPTKELRILTCFSAYTNLQKLFDQRRRAESLDMLDGLRVFAICWIVLGHSFDFLLLLPAYPRDQVEKYVTAWFMSPILNMPIGVELFFLLSGCLLSYHFLRARDKAEPFSIVRFYYKRFLRLTPSLVLMVMLDGGLIIHLSDGPLWKWVVGIRSNSCIDNWWRTLLYINNYINNANRICVPQTWYLSADSQLYVLSPLLLLPLAYSTRKGLLLLAACYVGTTVAAYCNAFSKELQAGAAITISRKTERNISEEYIKTHVRAASWLTGMSLGYILNFYKKGEHKLHISKMSAAAGWAVSVSLCVYGVYSVAPFQAIDYEYSRVFDSLHIALHRNLFSIGAAGVIFLCVAGKGGFMNDFLGWSGFRPLATLSYGVYLSHMSLQIIKLGSTREPYVYNMYNLLVDFSSDLLLANVAAVLIYISVEAPFWEIGQWLFNSLRLGSKSTNEPSASSDQVNEENFKTRV